MLSDTDAAAGEVEACGDLGERDAAQGCCSSSSVCSVVVRWVMALRSWAWSTWRRACSSGPSSVGQITGAVLLVAVATVDAVVSALTDLRDRLAEHELT
ncbi:hypothetical protein [Kibdelosporangium aridum]|uniref:hypothetical protein n=1 Tax=Kibdelosporangium aridum TaxID=2030 RepID=UPI0035E871B5